MVLTVIVQYCVVQAKKPVLCANMGCQKVGDQCESGFDNGRESFAKVGICDIELLQE